MLPELMRSQIDFECAKLNYGAGSPVLIHRFTPGNNPASTPGFPLTPSISSGLLPLSSLVRGSPTMTKTCSGRDLFPASFRHLSLTETQTCAATAALT